MTQEPITETYKPVSVGDLMWFGDEGEWIGCEGHVDLAAFTAAADELSREDCGLDDDELPSVDQKAEHIWLRPIERDDVTRERQLESGEDFERRVETYVDEGFAIRCHGDHERATAWTMIPTGA